MNSSIVFLNPLKVYCMVFGHSYKISKHVTDHIKEYKCERCSESFTTSLEGDIIKLTPKLEDINSVLKHLHNRKKADKIAKLGGVKHHGVKGIKVNPKNLLKTESLQNLNESKVISIAPE